jgi:hypothetical protein
MPFSTPSSTTSVRPVLGDVHSECATPEVMVAYPVRRSMLPVRSTSVFRQSRTAPCGSAVSAETLSMPSFQLNGMSMSLR